MNRTVVRHVVAVRRSFHTSERTQTTMPPNNARETSEGGTAATAEAAAEEEKALQVYNLYREELGLEDWPRLPPRMLVALPGVPGQQLWRLAGNPESNKSKWSMPHFLAHPALDLKSEDLRQQILATKVTFLAPSDGGQQRRATYVGEHDYAIASGYREELRETSEYHNTANVGQAQESGPAPVHSRRVSGASVSALLPTSLNTEPPSPASTAGSGPGFTPGTGHNPSPGKLRR